ncbi:MAG: DUF4129 domain-containing protein [Rhodospirillales bacterium]|nr:DUF4129 domain-containing protein [Rhodospirillales bacterium]
MAAELPPDLKVTSPARGRWAAVTAWPSVLAVLLGTFVAFAATWPASSAPGAASRTLALHLPEWLAGVAVMALASAGLSFFVALLPMPRRKDPDDFEMEPPPQPQGGKAVVLTLLALLLLGAAGTAWLLMRFNPAAGPALVGGMAQAPPVHPLAPAAPAPPAPPPRPLHIPSANGALTVLVAAISVGALAFAIWLFAERASEFSGLTRRRRRHRRLATAMAEAVSAGFEDLTDDPDPRRAVIACYRRCERAVAEVRHRRYPWQTPREYVEAALNALRLPRAAVTSLLAVFERARFGDAPVTGNDRVAALAALGDIRTALATEREHGTRR